MKNFLLINLVLFTQISFASQNFFNDMYDSTRYSVQQIEVVEKEDLIFAHRCRIQSMQAALQNNKKDQDIVCKCTAAMNCIAYVGFLSSWSDLECFGWSTTMLGLAGYISLQVCIDSREQKLAELQKKNL